METALVHDFLAQTGGAERVVEAIHRIYPRAPIYTSVYDPKCTLPSFSAMDIRTSFMQSWPIATGRLHRYGLAFYPAAFEQFDLGRYDLVISSSSSFAKGVITDPRTCHICYCHTPARFAWRPFDYCATPGRKRMLPPLLSGLMQRLREWDLQSAQRVDYFVANSMNVARRIFKYYRRHVSAVIYPPIQADRFAIAPQREIGEHFLVVSRLINYKRIDLAISACNALQAPLRIIGAGPEVRRLRRLAGPTVQFAGPQTDEQVAREMARCKALIFPGEEDFGMTPLEAMASGRPVVAFGAGGALETNIDGETGVLFREQTPSSLAAALRSIDTLAIDPEELRRHAMQFDESVFQARMTALVSAAMEEHRRNYTTGYIDKVNGSFNGERLVFRPGPTEGLEPIVSPTV